MQISAALSPMSFKGTWCSGITPAQHAGGPGFNPQRVHLARFSHFLVPMSFSQTSVEWGNQQSDAATTWTHWDLNPGPSACEADVIPLHHVPHVESTDCNGYFSTSTRVAVGTMAAPGIWRQAHWRAHTKCSVLPASLVCKSCVC